MQLFFFCFFWNEKIIIILQQTLQRQGYSSEISLCCPVFVRYASKKLIWEQIHHFQLMLADSNMSKLKCPRGNALIVLVPQCSVLVIILYQKTDQKRQKKSDLLVVFIASSVNWFEIEPWKKQKQNPIKSWQSIPYCRTESDSRQKQRRN